MRLDVFLTPRELEPHDLAGRTVAVIDILRATTTMAAAMAAGARSIIPVADPDEAIRLAASLGSDEAVLAGERGGVVVPGFALGNSPLEMTPATVGGRTVVMSTTNGTRALLAAHGARAVHPASAANLQPVAAALRAAAAAGDLAILCAGREGHPGTDDTYAAGRLLALVLPALGDDPALNDGARMALGLVARHGDDWAGPLRESAAGRDLLRLGFGADVEAAGTAGRWPLLLSYHDRRIQLIREAEAA